MQAGAMRHRVVVQSASESRAADGGVTLTWSDVSTRWAQIEPASGKEFFVNQQVAAEVTHKITLRNYDTLTTQHRLKFGTRYFNILSVLRPDEIKHTMQALAKEVV